MISLDYENQYKGQIVCGCDEVGRGPLAGPVVAAAVIPTVIARKTESDAAIHLQLCHPSESWDLTEAKLQKIGIDSCLRRNDIKNGLPQSLALLRNDEMIEGINDSKKISAKKRAEYSEFIKANYEYAIGEASVEEIEEINILNATKLAIQRAVDTLANRPDIVLVDGNMKFKDDRYISIIKGDQKSYSIACASIIAKVYRDKMMKELAVTHPNYGWEHNAGYGTAKHMKAIREYGITEHHRKGFLKNIL